MSHPHINTDDCMLYARNLGSNGYGRTNWYINGVNTSIQVHRAMYEYFIGPIPDGLVVDHLCRTPACINPDHLEPVTQKENLDRGYGISAINGRKTHCIKGHEFTPETTTINKNRGDRVCRLCVRERDRRYYKSRKQSRK